MSDRMAGQIWIGGKVSRTAMQSDDPEITILRGLIGALNDDGGSFEFGGPPISSDCTAENLPLSLDDESLLNLKNDQARNGEFEETEAFCFRNGIMYNRWSDHYCEYDAENAYWRPGMEGPMVIYADSDGYEIVSGDVVRQALETLENPRRSLLIKIQSAARQLKIACPELPPKLEKFEIVP